MSFLEMKINLSLQICMYKVKQQGISLSVFVSLMEKNSIVNAFPVSTILIENTNLKLESIATLQCKIAESQAIEVFKVLIAYLKSEIKGTEQRPTNTEYK